MRRRDFITLVGGVGAGWPFAAHAQQPPQPVIGYLSGGTSKDFARLTAAFRQGLNDSGYVEGRNVAIEYRWAEGQYDQLPALAADLARRQITLIAATTTPAALAAKGATSTIPIVFSIGADPIAIGLVQSLSRPSGNITGVNNYLSGVGAKRLELLGELIPNNGAIGLLVNPNFPDAESQSSEVKEAARTLGQPANSRWKLEWSILYRFFRARAYTVASRTVSSKRPGIYAQRCRARPRPSSVQTQPGSCVG